MKASVAQGRGDSSRVDAGSEPGRAGRSADWQQAAERVCHHVCRHTRSRSRSVSRDASTSYLNLALRKRGEGKVAFNTDSKSSPIHAEHEIRVTSALFAFSAQTKNL